MVFDSWAHRAGLVCVLAALAACNPSDRRPGLWLAGDPAPFATDWSFTDAEKEIAIEVHTPYLLPHSVTIWCASLDGALYIAASNPDAKRWPGWVEDDPNVRLLIGGKVYEARLEAVDDADTIDPLRTVYAAKYDLGGSGTGGAVPSVRYWRVLPRA
jgi:hypothetical protein